MKAIPLIINRTWVVGIRANESGSVVWEGESSEGFPSRAQLNLVSRYQIGGRDPLPHILIPVYLVQTSLEDLRRLFHHE